MAVIVSWRSGEVEILPRSVEGALTLARHAYDGKTLLIPGVPEAEDDGTALKAVLDFEKRLAARLLKRPVKGAA